MLLSYINYQDNIISIINIMFIKTYEVDDNNLNEFNSNVREGTAMVAYTADWCGHCKRLKPHWNSFQKKCDGRKCKNPVTIGHCDVPKYQNSAHYAENIQSFPTIVGFKNGRAVHTFTPEDGNRENPKDLERFLKKVMGESKKIKKHRGTKKKKHKKKSKKKKHKKKSKKKKHKKKKRTQRRSKRKNRKIRKKITKLIGKLGY